MNNRFQEIAGGKLKNYRPLVNGGGLSNLAIYITTAGGLLTQLTGSKQRGTFRCYSEVVYAKYSVALDTKYSDTVEGNINDTPNG